MHNVAVTGSSRRQTKLRRPRDFVIKYRYHIISNRRHRRRRGLFYFHSVILLPDLESAKCRR